MPDNDPGTSNELRSLTTGIVAAYVANHSVQMTDLPAVIISVHSALSALGQPPAPAQSEKPVPAVSIKKSITPDYLISLEDGRHYRTLARHLSGRGLTPAEYRAKWGLPLDYPMVAPNYSARRSELAKTNGLGRKKGEPAPAKGRGRKRVSA